MAFTRMCAFAHSLASASVNISTPPARAIGRDPLTLKLTKLVSEQVLMMQPLCCLIICGRRSGLGGTCVQVISMMHPISSG